MFLFSIFFKAIAIFARKYYNKHDKRLLIFVNSIWFEEKQSSGFFPSFLVTQNPVFNFNINLFECLLASKQKNCFLLSLCDFINCYFVSKISSCIICILYKLFLYSMLDGKLFKFQDLIFFSECRNIKELMLLAAILQWNIILLLINLLKIFSKKSWNCNSLK